jgi:hypothetical protein
MPVVFMKDTVLLLYSDNLFNLQNFSTQDEDVSESILTIESYLFYLHGLQVLIFQCSYNWIVIQMMRTKALYNHITLLTFFFLVDLVKLHARY